MGFVCKAAFADDEEAILFEGRYLSMIDRLDGSRKGTPKAYLVDKIFNQASALIEGVRLKWKVVCFDPEAGAELLGMKFGDSHCNSLCAESGRDGSQSDVELGHIRWGVFILIVKRSRDVR